MKRAIRTTRWVAGVVWFLSWFELYLEVYRYHHVTLPSVDVDLTLRTGNGRFIILEAVLALGGVGLASIRGRSSARGQPTCWRGR